MTVNTSSSKKRKRSFIGFYVEPKTKEKLGAIAAMSGCTMSDLMAALAERADTLCVFLQLPNRRSDLE